ncbi:MAG: excisionase family DNA binding protein [Verrucomicrobiales bacterium]|jgi:excisionase family DNA binding protein
METKTLGILTVSQAANYLNIPQPTLYQHLREGRLPGIQIGGRWRIETKVLQRFLGLEDRENEEENPTSRVPPNFRQKENTASKSNELEQLSAENKRLRAIIAEQRLELHELEADKGTLVFREEPSSE